MRALCKDKKYRWAFRTLPGCKTGSACSLYMISGMMSMA